MGQSRRAETHPFEIIQALPKTQYRQDPHLRSPHHRTLHPGNLHPDASENPHRWGEIRIHRLGMGKLDHRAELKSHDEIAKALHASPAHIKPGKPEGGAPVDAWGRAFGEK